MLCQKLCALWSHLILGQQKSVVKMLPIKDDPLQCSCLENPRDEGAWWAAVYGVAESDRTEAMQQQQQQQQPGLAVTEKQLLPCHSRENPHQYSYLSPSPAGGAPAPSLQGEADAETPLRECQLWHSRAVWPWASFLPALSHSFSIRKKNGLISSNILILLSYIFTMLVPRRLKWSFLFVCVCRATLSCVILVAWWGIEPGPSAVKAWSPNHWTARKFPEMVISDLAPRQVI